MAKRSNTFQIVSLFVLITAMISILLVVSGRLNITPLPLKHAITKPDAIPVIPVQKQKSEEGTEENPVSIPEFFEPDIVPSIVNGRKKPQNITERLIQGAVAQVGVTNSYNGAYQKIAYPNGDVDASTGVCTDVIIRAFRSIDIDLQKEIHQDMLRNFSKYPRKWGLKSPDTNIDHRRVPNMATYFKRKHYAVPISKNTDMTHYRPGDLVVWRISGKLTHIGIVSDELVPDTSHYYIIHNPIQGVEISDWLNEFEIINHFRLSDKG